MKDFKNNFFQYNNLIPLLAFLFSLFLFFMNMKSDIEVMKVKLEENNRLLVIVMHQHQALANKLGISLPQE